MPVVGTIGTDTILIGRAGFGFDIAIDRVLVILTSFHALHFLTFFHSAVELVAGGFGNRAPFLRCLCRVRLL